MYMLYTCTCTHSETGGHLYLRMSYLFPYFCHVRFVVSFREINYSSWYKSLVVMSRDELHVHVHVIQCTHSETGGHLYIRMSYLFLYFCHVRFVVSFRVCPKLYGGTYACTCGFGAQDFKIRLTVS